MYSVESLENAIRELYRAGVERGEYSEADIEHMLYDIDFISLVQAIRHNAETVHAYTTQSERPKSINYRGSDLFGQKATRLYTGFDQSIAEAVTASRVEELWLLEDMTITAVACVSVDFGGGAYCTEYREDKGSPWDSGIFLDLQILTDELLELCASYAESELPYYEL